MPKLDWLSVALLTSAIFGFVLLVMPEVDSGTAGGVAPPAATFQIPAGMVCLPGGTYPMGHTHGHEDEIPVHDVTVSPFLLDRHEVTNKQFAAFVKATGYTTQAEQDGYAWCYVKGADDFAQVKDAYWKQPQGPGSSIDTRMDHPVVCVSWHDAMAYAQWAGKRLPTEAEWEYAARAGGRQHVAARLTANEPQRRQRGTAPKVLYIDANIWQGTWPVENQLLDGFFYTAPVGHFAPNALGLENMVGNVWEWTADWYAGDYYSRSPRDNPTGPATGENRVARGGSWFCSANYCGAYNSHFRGASPPDHAFNNVGFRCAADVPAGDVINSSSTEEGGR